MIEFIKEFPWVPITGAICTLLTGVAAFIVSIINAKNIRHIDAHMDQAKRRGTVVVCPKCKKESPLAECHFLLPDGSIDDNLNGIADNKEV